MNRIEIYLEDAEQLLDFVEQACESLQRGKITERSDMHAGLLKWRDWLRGEVRIRPKIKSSDEALSAQSKDS